LFQESARVLDLFYVSCWILMAFQWCPHLENSRGDLVVGNHVFGFVIPVDFSRRTKTGKVFQFKTFLLRWFGAFFLLVLDGANQLWEVMTQTGLIWRTPEINYCGAKRMDWWKPSFTPTDYVVLHELSMFPPLQRKLMVKPPFNCWHLRKELVQVWYW